MREIAHFNGVRPDLDRNSRLLWCALVDAVERLRKCQSEALEQHGADLIRSARITAGENSMMIRIRRCHAIQFDLMLSKVSHTPTLSRRCRRYYVISKRVLGLARCYVKGWTHYLTSLRGSVFAHQSGHYNRRA